MATQIAILRAGGTAVRITPLKPRSIEGLSGLVIGGGADVDPKLYNEEQLMPELRRQLRKEVKRRWQRRETWALIGFTPEEGFKPSAQCQLKAAFKILSYRIGMILDLALLTLLWAVRHLMSIPSLAALREMKNRDELEVPLVREAIARGLPVFGICRGMQLINVCLGGSLHQEISVFYEETPILTTLLPRKRVQINFGSRLRTIMRRLTVRVNSLHFQAVKTLGHELHCAAVEANGVIQAIEHAGSAYIVGVQWHPEYLPLETSHQRLFASLVNAARNFAASPEITNSTRDFNLPSNDEAIANIAASQRMPFLGARA